MKTITPTEEQEKIVAHRDGPALVTARAGTAKTTTLLLRVKRLFNDRPLSSSDVLLTTFSRLGVADLRKRAGELGLTSMPEIKTLHSIAWKAIKSGGKANWKLPPDWWVRKVLKQAFDQVTGKASQSNYDDDGNWCGKGATPPLFTFKEVVQIIGVAKSNLVRLDAWTDVKGVRHPSFSEWAQATYVEEQTAKVAEACYRALEEARHAPLTTPLGGRSSKLKGFLGKDVACTHDDAMLEVAYAILTDAEWIKSIAGSCKHVVVDEAQDNNLCQWVLVRYLAKTFRSVSATGIETTWQNLMVVADEQQCVAGDTAVQTSRGKVRVRDLRRGDLIDAYRNGKVVRQTVRHVKLSSWKRGFRITTASGKSLLMSPNHKIWASTPELGDGCVAVYLMYRHDLGFRVGVTNRCRGVPFFGARAHMERAERLWILDICDNREDALLREESYSLKYGVPTCVFNGAQRSLNQTRLDAVFAEFGRNGQKILDDRDMSFDLPHWMANSYDKHSRVRRTVQLNAHSAKGTQVIFQWTGGAFDLSDLGAKTQRGGRHVIRKYFLNYREALAFAEDLAERVGGAISHRLSAPDRSESGYLKKITASGLLVGMDVMTRGASGVGLDRIVSVERVDRAALFDLDVDDASNFFGNDILSHNSIYGWRGARPDLLFDFVAIEGPQLSFYPLTMNFRSGQAILDVANKLLRTAKKKLFAGELRCGRPDIEAVVVARENEDTVFEAAGVADSIQAAILANRPPSEIAVLYRMNSQAGLVELELIRRAIPYRVAGRGFFMRPEVDAAIKYIALSLDETDEEAFETIYRLPFRWIKRDFLTEFPTLASLRGKPKGLVSARWKGATRLLKDMDALIVRLKEEGLVAALEYVFDEIGLREHCKRQTDDEEDLGSDDNEPDLSSEIDTAINELLACARISGDPISFLEFVREKRDQVMVEDPDGEKEDARVTLSTCHKFKGLERDDVYVIGMSPGLFPARGAPLEEERRLAYVALTRARRNLHVSWVENPSLLVYDAGLAERETRATGELDDLVRLELM